MNFGAAAQTSLMLDVQMMALHNAQERTLVSSTRLSARVFLTSETARVDCTCRLGRSQYRRGIQVPGDNICHRMQATRAVSRVADVV